MVRLAHISDIHVTANRLDWRMGDFFSKRITSWFNYKCLGRKKRFAYADEVLRHMVDDFRRRNIDHVVFSGDATALGFESEFRKAAELLQCERPAFPGLAVPGNHDYINRATERSGLFEKYFANWQTGVRIDDEVYPFAQRVGPVWLIGVNGSTGNRLPWDASGAVGRDQLDRLRRLFDRLDAGPRILVIHYPVFLSSQKREIRFRDLRDLDQLLRLAGEAGVSLWLHGHRHYPYHFQDVTGAPFPIICSGTATQTRIWGYNEYLLDERQVRAVRRIYDSHQRRFMDANSFEIELASPARFVGA